MRNTPASPHGFVTVRGRGYRPDQADAWTAALSAERDAAWERAARLTVLAREMGAELERLRATVAGLAPQTYDELGEDARDLFRLARREADAVRERARRAADGVRDAARAAAEGVAEEARARAGAVRAEADETARQRLSAARAEADAVRIAARHEVRAGRRELLAALRVTRRKAAALRTGQDERHTARAARAERAAERQAAALDARHAEPADRAGHRLAEAGRALAEAREEVRRGQEEAEARAAALLAEAGARAERIALETERVLCEHGEAWDDVQNQTATVRETLRILTTQGAE
ncbi:cellulose-binding protein [Streptomyces tagetis]|uniref:Cellulose-binding protein n=1 Tax=Streptomyces tagetis TaxID=2820809 RepID=A0A941B2T0_9ACTN|nr:cellulose-binding protein [Streptomyces sp. RG38]MBQ0829496.1 cellulose-binding protein [Streptomyces sp. RG38]